MNTYKFKITEILIAFITCLIINLHSIVPTNIIYQGFLTIEGSPANGTKSITFKIIHNSNPIWTDTMDLEVINGAYTAMLPIPVDTINPSNNYQLNITVGSTELIPDVELQSVPYAYYADQAYVSYYASSLNNIVNISNGNVGIGTETPEAKLDVKGDIRFQPAGAPATKAVGVYYAGQGFTTIAQGWIHITLPPNSIPLSVTMENTDWGFSHASHDVTQGIFTAYDAPGNMIFVTGFFNHTYEAEPSFANFAVSTTYPNLKIWVSYMKE
ncbi:hypothetical protein ACFL6D_02405 [Spirochaetota bacterium]